MTRDALIAVARAWIAEDPDPHTRASAEQLLSADTEALAEHFGARLQFGTAGLRGALGPGPNRMNRANVRRVSAGLGDYLLASVSGAAEAGVVIGYDGRHGSLPFAQDTAAVLVAKGFRVWLYEGVVPTPQLAHAVPYLGCAAGVMVTASHNPPQDNGYKVYWSNGAQIIPPHDTGISEAIDAIGALSEVEVPALAPARQQGRLSAVPEAVLADYLAQVAALRVHTGASLRIVYTAMHGVGGALVRRVLAAAGHHDLHPVAEQFAPDPDFPTVSFPNPEEPGALDLAIAKAEEVGAELIVANDPDADRLAVAVPDGAGGWRPLTGNQVGALFGDDLLTHGAGGAERLVATTIVSSVLLSRMAARHGVHYAETLTGFKWIANRAIAHDADGGRFVLGYEEALGYSVGPVVRDKDGVSAILLFADLAAHCKAQGVSVLEKLTAIYREYGLHAALQRAQIKRGAAGAAEIRAILAGLRQTPPREIAGVEVVKVSDVQLGRWQDLRTGETGSVDLPSSNVLAWDLADGSRVLARPSGTEPKIKFYFEVVEPMAPDDTLAAAEARAQLRLEAMAASLVP